MKEILVIDFNVALHDQLRARGVHVHYGDFSKSETLLKARVDAARLVISSVRDDLMRGVDTGNSWKWSAASIPMLRSSPMRSVSTMCPRSTRQARHTSTPATSKAARALSKAVERALNGELAGWVRNANRKIGPWKPGRTC